MCCAAPFQTSYTLAPDLFHYLSDVIPGATFLTLLSLLSVLTSGGPRVESYQIAADVHELFTPLEMIFIRSVCSILNIFVISASLVTGQRSALFKT